MNVLLRGKSMLEVERMFYERNEWKQFVNVRICMTASLEGTMVMRICLSACDYWSGKDVYRNEWR